MEATATNLHNIALLIDQENVHSCKLSIGELLDALNARGRVTLKRAYGDWGRFNNIKHELLGLGIDLIELPTMPKGKNRADMRLVVDAMEIALTKDHIRTFVIVTGDSDFVQLAARLRELDRYVIFVAREDSASTLLQESCDELVYIKPPQRVTKSNRTRPANSNGAANDNQSKAVCLKLIADTAPSTSSVSKVTDGQVLDMVGWTLRYISEIGDESVTLSRFNQVLLQLFPQFKIASFGFPKNGRWIKFVQALESYDWLLVDYDSINKTYRLKATVGLLNRIKDQSMPARVQQQMEVRQRRMAIVLQSLQQAKNSKAVANDCKHQSDETAITSDINQMSLPFSEDSSDT